MDLIIASNNKNKIKEIKELLKDLNINIKSLSDVNCNIDIEENGNTFDQNAYIKASAIYKIYKCPVLADDSGLCVEALDGQPGVYSHRYAGPECNDDKNNLKLIKNLNGVLNRNAYYACAICFIDHKANANYAFGKIEGKIIDTPKGNNGFGYDPYFFLPEENKTMAELSLEDKNKISHRAIALKKIGKIIHETFNN